MDQTKKWLASPFIYPSNLGMNQQGPVPGFASAELREKEEVVLAAIEQDWRRTEIQWDSPPSGDKGGLDGLRMLRLRICWSQQFLLPSSCWVRASRVRAHQHAAAHLFDDTNFCLKAVQRTPVGSLVILEGLMAASSDALGIGSPVDGKCRRLPCWAMPGLVFFLQVDL